MQDSRKTRQTKIRRNTRIRRPRGVSTPHVQAASRRGFTLLELTIVILIIMVLIGMAAGNYQNSVIRSKEAVLAQDLYVMRQAIDQYTLDKQEAPQSLDDLVSAGYLRAVPVDPMTGGTNWNLEFGDTVMSAEQTTTGVSDVHSSSTMASPFSGKPYSEW